MRTGILADNQDMTREGIVALLKESGLSDRIVEVKTSGELQTSEGVILQVMVLDKTTKEIARREKLSFHTINSYRKIFSASWR